MPTSWSGTRRRGPTFDFDLDGMVLDGAVAAIADKRGEPIYLPGSLGKTVLHGKLTGVTAQVALETVLAPVHMGFERRAGFSITPDET